MVDGDETALEALLSKLMARRKGVPDLILDSPRGRINPFPLEIGLRGYWMFETALGIVGGLRTKIDQTP